MRRWLAALIILAPLTALAQQREPECIRVTGEARWGASAYNHYVRVENACDRAARCQVATNVNPQPQTIDVPAGETVEVITFRGSPAREFTPNVTCELR